MTDIYIDMAYVYRHIRLDKNVPFYIGIGADEEGEYERAFYKYKRNKHWMNVINKTEYEVDILIEGLLWEEACLKEKEFIKLYGRRDIGTGTLVNMTNGGDGTSGRVLPYDSYRKMRERLSIPVARYDKSGKFIDFFNSGIEAGKILNIDHRLINSCINRVEKCKSAGGFMWRKYYGSKEDILPLKHEIKGKSIRAYDKKGKFIGIFGNAVIAARELGIKNYKGIVCVLKGKMYRYHGYIFNYNLDNCVDDIAPVDFYAKRKGSNNPMYGRKGELSALYGIKGADHHASKKVYKICIESGDVLSVYDSLTLAAVDNNTNSSNISKCCRGVYKKANGFKWQFVNSL